MSDKKDDIGTKMLSKRDFMKASSLAIGGAILAAGTPSASLAASKSKSAIKWDYEADVIVIGTGPAGLSCATAAAENGASVIAIDANDKIGGKGILSGGNLGIGGGTRMQKDLGYVETADIIYEDRTVPNLRTDATMTVRTIDDRKVKMGMWRKISGAEDGEGMARAFADNSLATWNWLDEMGCTFIKAQVSKMSQVYRGTRYYTLTARHYVDRDNAKPGDLKSGGAGIIWPLYDRAVDNDVKFMLSCKMTKIIRENGDGRVVGIEATYKGKTIHLKGKKAVFLGTGSWNGNNNLKALFLPWLTKYPHISGEPYVKNDGKGIEAAIEIGASLSTDRGCDWHGWHRHPGSRWHRSGAPFGIRGFEDGFLDSENIYVNAEGNRFMNEEVGEDNPAWVGGAKPFYFAQICASQTTDKDGPVVWIILDETSRLKQKLEFKPGENVETFMYGKGNSLKELAAAIKVPAANLEASVKRYNELVAKGKDEDFGKLEMTAQILTPPFHAVKWGIQKHNTLGGVTINPKSRVLDWKRQPIPGLYAAGECAGAMDLIGLARPLVFGRIAGITIAKEEK